MKSPAPAPSRVARSAFTLLELMVVIGIMAILMLMIVPAFTTIKSAKDTNSIVYMISGAFEQARTYAVANNTYVWVGFFEDDPTIGSPKSPADPGIGQLTISTVASTDGSRIYRFVASTTGLSTTAPPPLDSAASGTGRLIQIVKLAKIPGVHMVSDVGALALPSLSATTVKLAYQIGNTDFGSHPVPPNSKLVANPTTFSYPIGSATPEYTFAKIIEFNPRGEAIKIVSDLDGPIDTMAVGLQPAHGNVVDAKAANVASVTVSGLTGASRIHRR